MITFRRLTRQEHAARIAEHRARRRRVRAELRRAKTEARDLEVVKQVRIHEGTFHINPPVPVYNLYTVESPKPTQADLETAGR